MREQAPLLGRDAEIATLEQVVAMAARRQRAQLVLLSGEAGVGKSRLASELGLRAARDSGAEVLTGQCVPYGDANVFVAVAEAVRRACLAGDGAPVDADAAPGDQSEVVPEADLRARVGERVTKALGLPAEEPENERMVEGLMHLIDGVTRPGVDPTTRATTRCVRRSPSSRRSPPTVRSC